MRNTKIEDNEGYEKGLTNIFPFTTLLKNDIKRSWTNTWYPIPTKEYRKILKINTGDKTNENHETLEILLNNLSYNLQYLEFLEKELNELQPSSVLIKMLQKTYVITANSIIEGIFINIAFSNGWTKKKAKNIDFSKAIELLREHSTDKYIFDKKLLDEVDDLREFRNKVHLAYEKPQKDQESQAKDKSQTVEKANGTILEHDYNSFDENVKARAGRALRTILRSPEVSSNPDYFDFLDVNLINEAKDQN